MANAPYVEVLVFFTIQACIFKHFHAICLAYHGYFAQLHDENSLGWGGSHL